MGRGVRLIIWRKGLGGEVEGERGKVCYFSCIYIVSTIPFMSEMGCRIFLCARYEQLLLDLLPVALLKNLIKPVLRPP